MEGKPQNKIVAIKQNIERKKQIKNKNQRIIQKQKQTSKFSSVLKDPKLLKKIAMNCSSN
jgi:hypothetical protein